MNDQTSEPEKLLPVIQADREAAMQTVPDDGSHSSYMMVDAISEGRADDWPLVQAFARHRLSSPVSGTDMVMVPRALAEKLAKFATEWDRWQAKGSTSTERMVTFSYGQARIGIDDFRAVHALLSASPSTPIPVIAEAGLRGFAPHLPRHMRQAFFDAVDAVSPVIAEAGERERIAQIVRDYCRNGILPEPCGGSLDTADLAAGRILDISTPATLDNTADPRPDRRCDYCGPGWKGAHKYKCPRAHEDNGEGGPVDD